MTAKESPPSHRTGPLALRLSRCRIKGRCLPAQAHFMSDKALYHSPPRLTFVRHAETFANINKVWHGQTDTALTEHGHQQTQLLGQHFHHHPGAQAGDVALGGAQRSRQTQAAVGQQGGKGNGRPRKGAPPCSHPFGRGDTPGSARRNSW